MTDAPRQPSGFWNRLTRRTKILVLVDVIVLATLLVAAVLYVTDPWSDSSSETIATSDTTTAAPQSPLRTRYGLAWITAACGSRMVLEDSPQSPLPQAIDYVACIAPGTIDTIVIGAYDDEDTLDGDLAGMRTAHRHATHVDDNGKHWLVVVEGDSDVPLEPLRRYGFRIG
ncbi:hypothetical protein H7I77_14650 [Mycolicibacterium novocastrense]|uniref:Secreted protein n=1 Tax=Mycolicibacterium novocastrense TaxID=59813 RepID=A0AAW5SM49_MYCNV|nr:hypothetical protein [Mycolicibacterium novocastrense]MCV7024571.1 hypothetical protein [Mycolicibacterium novocastrense]GAT11429.1 uncharacterized protein RMCN_4562 [Mycolicibacterium novocastrense]